MGIEIKTEEGKPMKVCNLCLKGIDTKKERYTHIEDWIEGKMIKDVWCHLTCFTKAMNKDLTHLERQAQEMLQRALPILDRFAPQEEVYEIK